LSLGTGFSTLTNSRHSVGLYFVHIIAFICGYTHFPETMILSRDYPVGQTHFPIAGPRLCLRLCMALYNAALDKFAVIRI
jgi:hypothetical protein